MSIDADILMNTRQIPAVATSLLGREREVEQLSRMLADPACRLVTITGPGGIGKTRLALHMASTLVRQPDVDIVFVPLDAVRDPLLALSSIGRAFGLISDPHDNYETFLIDRLEQVRAVVVLDNLEQVLAVGPALGRILARCPGVTMLATSQAALGIGGEHLFPLAPLAIPDASVTSADAILDADAVALFIERARAVKPAFEIDEMTAATIGELCRRLDGLPLAIELAAARMNILTPQALLDRLAGRLDVLGGERPDVPDRLRTIRSAVAWSHDLLAPDEQRLFRYLAAFSGGFPLEAVEETVSYLGMDRDPYNLLGMLVDRSLVQASSAPNGDPRYFMLETLRLFGLDQLEQMVELDDARFAHAQFVVTLAEAAEPNLVGSEQSAWLVKLDAEIGNIRAAVEWALDAHRDDLVLRIGGAIWRFLSARGLVTEGRGWLERALQASGPDIARFRVKALNGAANLAEDQRDLETASTLFEQARHLAAAIGLQMEESRALIGLGTVAHDRGDYDIALEHHQRATMLAREAGDQRGIAVGLGNLAAVSYYRGQLEQAAQYWDEGQEILYRIGDRVSAAIGDCNLGAVWLELRDFERAEQHLQRALKLQRQLNHQRDLPATLINLGEAARELGDYTLSHDAFAEAIQILRKNGESEGVALHGMAQLALAQGDEPGAVRYLLESVRLVAERDDIHSLLECAHVVADLCSRRGQHAAVVELLSADVTHREKIGSPRTETMEEYLAPFQEAAKDALDQQEMAAQVASGRRLDAAALARRMTIFLRELAGTQRPFPVGGVERQVAEIEHNLTARELDILRLLAQGYSTKEIADTLFISPRTIATHITNILAKLEVPSRTAAVAWAIRTGIV